MYDSDYEAQTVPEDTDHATRVHSIQHVNLWDLIFFFRPKRAVGRASVKFLLNFTTNFVGEKMLATGRRVRRRAIAGPETPETGTARRNTNCPLACNCCSCRNTRYQCTFICVSCVCCVSVLQQQLLKCTTRFIFTIATKTNHFNASPCTRTEWLQAAALSSVLSGKPFRLQRRRRRRKPKTRTHT